MFVSAGLAWIDCLTTVWAFFIFVPLFAFKIYFFFLFLYLLLSIQYNVFFRDFFSQIIALDYFWSLSNFDPYFVIFHPAGLLLYVVWREVRSYCSNIGDVCVMLYEVHTLTKLLMEYCMKCDADGKCWKGSGMLKMLQVLSVAVIGFRK